jgi:fructose-1,6-bisphosphatase II / sedoheptulose-1,7-bisphosphatase
MAQSAALSDSLAFLAAQAAFKAAVAASSLAGRGDEKAADQAAVDALRTALNAMTIKGRIVIGEGERDEAPMLYIGEEVGLGTGPEIDIALDPLEGTTLTAKAMANALAVMAFAPKGGLLYAPDTYMDKIAVGPGYPAGIVELDAPAGDNAKALAKAKGVPVREIGVCVLDRPRHAGIIASLRSVGARVHLISDGDVAGVINTTDPSTGIDLYLGQGGAPEGVLAAAALRCVGGQFFGRLVFRNDDERARAEKTGVTNFDKQYTLEELVTGDAIFVAAGVTNGSLLKGIQIGAGKVRGQALVMNSATGLLAQIDFTVPAG